MKPGGYKRREIALEVSSSTASGMTIRCRVRQKSQMPVLAGDLQKGATAGQKHERAAKRSKNRMVGRSVASEINLYPRQLPGAGKKEEAVSSASANRPATGRQSKQSERGIGRGGNMYFCGEPVSVQKKPPPQNGRGQDRKQLDLDRKKANFCPETSQRSAQEGVYVIKGGRRGKRRGKKKRQASTGKESSSQRMGPIPREQQPAGSGITLSNTREDHDLA